MFVVSGPLDRLAKCYELHRAPVQAAAQYEAPPAVRYRVEGLTGMTGTDRTTWRSFRGRNICQSGPTAGELAWPHVKR